MWIPWGAYVFHISSLWGWWWASCCVICCSSLPSTLSWENFLQTSRRCPQLSVTFFWVDRTSYAFHAAVLISRVFVIEYLKCLDFTCSSQHVVNIPCIMEKNQRVPGWVWVKNAMRRDPASWTAFSSTVQNSECSGKDHWCSCSLYIFQSSQKLLGRKTLLSISITNIVVIRALTLERSDKDEEKNFFSVIFECVSSAWVYFFFFF